MKIINTIDLWTEQFDNHYECFNGAFMDGIDDCKIPFDRYKVIKNCNCYITVEGIKDIIINNKHQAIIFYKEDVPVRLVVFNKNTDAARCIDVALGQHLNGIKLRDIYQQHNIKVEYVDLEETSDVKKDILGKKETDVGSCDRWSLLCCMLKGSYTESESSYGNFESDRYEFVPDISIKYQLDTKEETFDIEHRCAFINTIKTRIIPIQENSPLTGLKVK